MSTNGQRYKIVEWSQSGHCCFEFTVVDTTKPVMIGGEHFDGKFDAICETFDRETAEFINRAVNYHNALVAERDILKSTHDMMDQHVQVLLAQKRQLIEALTLCQTWVEDDPFMKAQVAAALAAARVPC